MKFDTILLVILSYTTAYAVSIDCPKVIQFAKNLRVQNTQPTIWTQLQNDCCSASGITCDGVQRVTQIGWWGKGLNGFINGTAIPSSLTYLALHNNDIVGVVPSGLPSGLIECYLDGNQMSGDLPIFPSALRYLHLGWNGYPGNHFSGTLELNRPIQLSIFDNWISDVVIQDISALAQCDLSKNPLLGNPNIAGLVICTKNGLYSAGLLPVTKSTSSTNVASTSAVGKTTQLLPTTVVLTAPRTVVSTKLLKTTSPSSLSHTTFVYITVGAKTTFDRLQTTMETPTATTQSTIQAKETLEYTMELTGEQVTKIGRSSIDRIDAQPKSERTTGTISFILQEQKFVLNLKMLIRVFIDWFIFVFVLFRTPFWKAFKRTMNKEIRELK